MGLRNLWILALTTAAALPRLSQTSAAQKPAFEVVSIKPNASAQAGGSMGPRGTEFFATNMTLRNLIFFAYRPQTGQLQGAQIIGGPEWAQQDRFDIQAKAEGDLRAIPATQLRLMVQSMLEDRFQLKAHREQRELPTYDLIVASSGLRMKVSDDQSPPDPRQGFINFDPAGEQTSPVPRGAMRIAGGPSSSVLSANAIPVSKLVDSLLQGQADRIIFDKTNLSGLFDIRLQFSRESGAAGPDVTSASPSDPAFPSLFTAIQELGLKLQPAKTLLDVVVIDSAQKPKPN